VGKIIVMILIFNCPLIPASCVLGRGLASGGTTGIESAPRGDGSMGGPRNMRFNERKYLLASDECARK